MNGHKSTGILKMIFANASTNHAQPHTTGILQPALANAMMLMVQLQALKPIAMIYADEWESLMAAISSGNEELQLESSHATQKLIEQTVNLRQESRRRFVPVHARPLQKVQSVATPNCIGAASD
jgi:hypothetical protein